MESRAEQLSAQMEAVNAELVEERKQREVDYSELRAMLVREKDEREARLADAEKNEASASINADEKGASCKTEVAGEAAPIIANAAAKVKKSKKKPRQKVEHEEEEDDNILVEAMARASVERQRLVIEGKVAMNALFVSCRHKRIPCAMGHEFVARAVVDSVCCYKCGKTRIVGEAVASCSACNIDFCKDCVDGFAGHKAKLGCVEAKNGASESSCCQASCCGACGMEPAKEEADAVLVPCASGTCDWDGRS